MRISKTHDEWFTFTKTRCACLIIARGASSGHLGELVSNIQKKFFKNIEHSKNEWISSIAMEKALAEDSFKVSNVMEWVKSLNSFFQIHSTALVNMGNGLKNKFELF